MAVQEAPKGLSCSALSIIRHSEKVKNMPNCIERTKNLVAMPQFCTSDLSVGQWTNVGPRGRRTTIVASAYWANDEKKLPKAVGEAPRLCRPGRLQRHPDGRHQRPFEPVGLRNVE